jgi:hypothetical protein
VTPLTIGPMTHAVVELSNGNAIQVEEDLETSEKKLSDAARSGQARLAWFTERGTGHSVGVNPDQVAALRSSELPG